MVDEPLKPHPMKITPLQFLTMFAAAFFTSGIASAGTYSWTGASGTDLLWATPGNWDPAGPPTLTDSAIFNDEGATNSSGADAADNVVGADFSIAALAYSQTNGFHNTFLASGVTLVVSNSAAGNVLLAGTETDNGSSQRETNTVSGSGALVLNNPSANVLVRQGSAAGNGAKSTLDLSGLDTFTAMLGRLLVGTANSSPSINRSTGMLLLAKTNTITARSSTVAAIDVGHSSSNNGGGSLWYLGQTNAIFAASIATGSEKETGSSILFNPAFTSPVAYFRAADGVSRVNIWSMGDGGANSGTTTCRGTDDFTGGYVDAQVNTIVVGRASTAGTGANTSTGILTFDAGVVDVNTLQAGLQTSANNKSGNGTVNVNGTGTLLVNATLELGHTTGGNGAASTSGTLNINGGTVIANVITNAGAGTTAINLSDGKLVVTNYGGSVGTTVSPIGALGIGDSILTLAAAAGTPSVVANIFFVSSITNNTINIASIPMVSAYPAQFPLIQATALNSADFVLGALPASSPNYQGYISNNFANSSVDLVLTNGPTLSFQLEWAGTASDVWDTTSLNWLKLGTPVAFNNGQPVQFDDSATGPTTINLSATLLPGDLIVSNSSKTYAFTGPGSIAGGTGLTKAGTGTLIVDNSAGNAFSGSITIDSGAVHVGNSDTNGTLPSSAILDNGELAWNRADSVVVPNAISGAGSFVQEGTGSVALTGADTYTGATLANAGLLLVNTTLAGGGVLTNAPGATLGGNGTNTGPVTASGIINPGNGPTAGSFGAGDLTLYPGAGLAFDMNPADATPGSGINDIIEVAGNLALNNNQVMVNFEGLPAIGVPYRLMDYSGTRTGSFNPVVGGTHYTAALDLSTPNQVNVTFSGSGANLKWNSTSSGSWDIGVSANWLNLANSSPDVFYSGDTVLFDDSVAGVVTNINIGAGVLIAPTALTNISSANNFTITGAGQIIGGGSIVKGGTSLLALNTANPAFTGPIDVMAGTLQVGSGSALGTPANGATIETGAALDVNGQNLGSKPITVSGAGVGGLGAIINSGAQQINALKVVTLAGDTTFGGTGRWDIRGGSASISTGGQPYNIIKTGTNQVSLVAVNPIDAALGNIDIQEGIFAIQTTTTQVGDSTKTITVHTNAILDVYNLSASTVNKAIVLLDGSTIYSENGHSTIDGNVTLQSGTGAINVNSAGTAPGLIMSGVIGGPGGLLKIGNAQLALTGLSSYTGPTTVSNGFLYVEGSIGGSVAV